MLTIINDLPDDVVAISAEGKITGIDYETVLVPAIEEKLKTYKKLKMLYYLGTGFSGFEIAALLDDAKIGIKHLTIWDKVALVSNHQILDAVTKMFGYILPTTVRVFKNTELEEAKKWISE